MANEKEINISNKSYTNKDFASIYPELIDLVHNLTTRWDPQTSNESDPGVVITKEIAFLGDKLNYNIDKNVLETFMPSCTQETSMRQNCESRGYEMSYYNSGETEVTFTYNKKLEGNDTIKMSKLKTVVTSDDKTISYVITRDIEFTKDILTSTVPAIEGELATLTVASSVDETSIQLSNLDDNNRIYFPQTNVAQNGIFISNKKYLEWHRVFNLNVEELGKPNYKFGYDSRKNLPYLEFPRDIANLIGEGITIQYIITKGRDGNVSANYLTNLYSSDASKNNNEEYSFDLDSEIPELYIKNESASINGRDIETIDEAYESYKRTIGVFDTLVTCRDYESAIYNLYRDGYPLVSNIHVADRRDDINYSTRYITYADTGIRFVNCEPSETTATPYDLMLYSLTPIKSYTLENYYASFRPLDNNQYIIDDIEDSKCVSHTYKDLKDSDIYAILNKAILNARLVTTYKVNNYERAQIIKNVQQALIENFNARKVEYGQEIPYDVILKVIQNADNRISSVALSEPTLSVSYLNKNGVEIPQNSYSDVPVESGASWFTLVLAKNILNGKISLLNFNDDFNFDLNESDASILKNLTKVESHANITLRDNTDYPLNDNEVIQIVGPSLLDALTYSAYVYYKFQPSDSEESISDGSCYKLKPDDKLYIYYVDSDKNPQTICYEAGSIIQPVGFTLEETSQDGRSGTVQKSTTKYGTMYFKSLGASEAINVKKLNYTKLGKLTYCYWLRNNSNNDLFEGATIKSSWSSSNVALDVSVDAQTFVNVYDYGAYTFTYNGTNWTYDGQSVTLSNIGVTIEDETPVENDTLTVTITKEIILDDNEYFFYTDSGFNTLVTIGSGTTISTNKEKTFDWTAERVSLQDIVEKGLLSLKDVWKQINFTYDNDNDNGTYLDVQENSIITLVKDDKIKFVNLPEEFSEGFPLDNFLQDIPADVECYYNDNPITKYDIQGMTWKIKSRLDIVASKTKSQTLKTNQTIKFSNKDEDYIELTNGKSFNLNLATDIAGGESIDLTSLDANNEQITPLSVYSYTKGANIIRDANGYASIKLEGSGPSSTKTYSVPNIGRESVLMIYWVSSGTLTISGTNGNISLYTDKPQAITPITTSGMYVLYIPSTVTAITFTANAEGTLTLDSPRYYDGYNPALGIENLGLEPGDIEAVQEELEERIKKYSDGKFYYSYKVDNASAIDSDDLSSPYALFDYNNVANKCTIEQIDIEKSDIDIARSSRQ